MLFPLAHNELEQKPEESDLSIPDIPPLLGRIQLSQVLKTTFSFGGNSLIL